jgi:hypothetical protein
VCYLSESETYDFKDRLYDLTEKHVQAYANCLSEIICKVPRACYYCGDCDLIINIEQRYENNNIDNITYRQWMTIDVSPREQLCNF